MSILNIHVHFLLLAVILMTSCGSTDQPSPLENTTIEKPSPLQPHPQIAEYIRNIFQDKNGHFWFGTNGYGVAHYNGDSVSYFSDSQGFAGQQITGIAEDPEKNIWFATDQGIVKYDWSSNAAGEKQFTNYPNSLPYFRGERFWSVCADRKGHIWAGAVTGIFRFDGENWTPFELPYPEAITGNFITKATAWSIMEDRAGNMWFSTNGYGAYKYDGLSFTQYAEKDGLTNNEVDQIIEDSKGNIWFGTRFGGVSRYDGKVFTNYTANDSIDNNEVCVIYEDKAGNIWFSAEGYGVYCYDGTSFRNYSQAQGLAVLAVQTIFEDREGRLWAGGGGGLYQFDGNKFFNVTRYGPWD